MPELTGVQSDLLRAARDARERAYAPYSGFSVGAALRLRDGRVFTGCNVENASYALTVCAERVALASALSHCGRGGLDVEIIAVDAGPGNAAPPCGACRQVLAELAPDAVVIWSDGAAPRISSVAALLPETFRLHGDHRDGAGR
jgi:cytidine deaminase